MTKTAALCFLTLSLGGCFDFDKLRQPLDGGVTGGADLSASDGASDDDLSGADLSGGADLAGGDAARPPIDLSEPDGGFGVPQARLIGTAWYGTATTTLYSSPGMLDTQYVISADGIVDGDALFFFGSVDDGSGNAWPNVPTGFAAGQNEFPRCHEHSSNCARRARRVMLA